MKIIGVTSTILVTLIVSQIWRGYVLSKLWLWFIASTFGVAALGIAQAIGISLVVSLLTYQYDSYDDKEKSWKVKMVSASAFSLLSPALALLIGWVVKGFIG